MNAYMLQILQMLIYSNGEVEINSLITRLNITKRMINYYLKQLNDFLRSFGLNEIVLSNDKMFLNIEDSNRFMNTLKQSIKFENYIFNVSERQELIILLIGLSDENIGFESLIDYFKVSKNTISNDLISIKKQLELYDVKLLNKNKCGYYLYGDELMIRYILMSCFHHHENFIISKIKEELLIDLLKDDIDKNSITKKINDILIESTKYSVDSDFSYLAINDLVETILLISLRKNIRALNSNEISNEDKIDSIDYVVNEFNKINLNFSGNEEIYLYYVLQSAKVSKYNQAEYSPNVLNLMKDIIENFEEICKVNLFGENELSYMFLTHIKSMYYRTKYRIKITNFEATNTDDTVGYYYISKRVMEHVASKYNLTYDDDEVRLLSYYFASLDNESETKETKNNIIVVQISGISNSLFLKNQCSKIFGPQFTIKLSDKKHLAENIDNKTKLIITTVNLQGVDLKDNKVIKVRSILTDEDKQELLEWYLDSDCIDGNQEVIHDVLDIIKNYAIIQDKQKLYYHLNNYFRGDVEEKKLKLSNIFSPAYIRIADSFESWQEMLFLAGEPLIDEEIINVNYVEDIVKVLEEHGPYCECMDGVLVAHAEPKNNVKCPSLSLAVVKEPLHVQEWHKDIRAIFVLGVVDTELHANAFSELMANLVKDDLYLKLNTIDDCEEIFKKITL